MASVKTQLKSWQAGKNKLAVALVCLQAIGLQLLGYLPAYAADDRDSASWIKQSLSRMAVKSDRPAASKAGKKTGLAAQPVMMPFVANRHLPSQHELLMAEQAKFDNSAGTQTVLQRQSPRFDNLPLNGTISAYGAPATPAPISDSETRAWQDEAARALRHIGENRPRVAHRHVKAPVRNYEAVTAAQPPAGGQAIRQTGALLIESPMITPDERTMIDGANQMTGGNQAQQDDIARSLLNENANAQTGEAAGSEFGSAGPPPFPLNLIPPQALHDLIARGHHQKIYAPPAYFGSWHQAQAQGLPSGGFHSNISARSFGFSHFVSYAPAYRSYRSHAAAFRPYRASLHMCRTRRVLAKVQHGQPPVLTYPPYSRLSMF